MSAVRRLPALSTSSSAAVTVTVRARFQFDEVNAISLWLTEKGAPSGTPISTVTSSVGSLVSATV